MAAKKASAKKASTKAPAKTAATKKAPASSDVPKLDQLTVLMASMPPLAAQVRLVYRQLHTADACKALGGKTVARDVLREGVLWASAAAQALQTKDVPLYPTRRLVFFVECLTQLNLALSSAPEHGPATAGRARRDKAAVHLAGVREVVLMRLDEVIGDNDDWRAELKRVTGRQASVPTLLAASRELVKLLNAWLGRGDGIAVLLEDAHINAGTVSSLDEAIADLSDADMMATGATQLTDLHDSPEVNAIEGRVLYEMRSLMHAFAQARRQGIDVPGLVPGKATASVLGTHTSSKPKPKTP